jgi:hypothetical protein
MCVGFFNESVVPSPQFQRPFTTVLFTRSVDVSVN